MKTYAIIMAAGKGTRMKSLLADQSKVSYPILEIPLVKHVLNSLKEINVNRKITIVGFGGPMTEKIVSDESEVVYQHEQKGTGHAIMQAAPLLEGLEGQTIILSGDVPLLRGETLKKLIDDHVTNKNALTILTALLDNPHGYGRVVRKEDKTVSYVVEHSDASSIEKEIKEVNAGIYVFNNKLLFSYLKKLKPANKQNEYYLTDLIKMFKDDNLQIGAVIVDDFNEMLGINDRYQLEEATRILVQRINKKHMLNGITIEDKNSTYISPYAEIAPDTIIKPGTHILGKTKIGTQNTIGPNTFLNNVLIGNNNNITFSHISDSEIGSFNEIGPFTKMRAHVVIKNHTRLGNFVELKACVVEDYVKAAHLSYLGDVHIDEKTNVGCGTIVANYDGLNKHKTYIGKKVFIGSNVTIISPVTVGDGSLLAAGSTINKDVQENEMAIARARQENKVDGATKFREKIKKIKEDKK
ncbi:MAG: bifunctional UDP-N-acetylglucosamine diphosphorylase/glucosamine-1-phosphate N-acetyltransferase GlmU [Bacilli bacterium]